MKIKTLDDLLIVYLYNMKLDLTNKNELTKNIKVLLEKIINFYSINLSGIYEVVIYENKFYGYVLEIKKIKDFEYGDFLDLKISIKNNQNFYLVVDNYNFIEDFNNIFYKNNLYYVNVCNIKNVNILFEYGDILYKDNAFIFDDCVKIK